MRAAAAAEVKDPRPDRLKIYELREALMKDMEARDPVFSGALYTHVLPPPPPSASDFTDRWIFFLTLFLSFRAPILSAD